ncbi:unnamed protein product [Kuraishia capsulata CBS 1993]|uniref:Uncharacterized protein n=1 Tax=Kuraishia capsulata CBS 1993 TaxID=1382522 RepID=W6MPY1_9ASCO|nr:uncharacterized protein KUCA_T00004700001 [Kuraishia capsulata CBS 1993]CDK28716.1 unnamed protein product [Kuraishia capsulata CBS 1993]
MSTMSDSGGLPVILEDSTLREKRSTTSIFSEASSTPTAPTTYGAQSSEKLLQPKPVEQIVEQPVEYRTYIKLPERQTLKHKLSRDVLKSFLTGSTATRVTKPKPNTKESRGIKKDKKFSLFGIFKRKKNNTMKTAIETALANKETASKVNITNIHLPSASPMAKETPAEMDNSSKNNTFDTTDYDTYDSFISSGDEMQVKDRKDAEICIRKSQMSLGHFRENVLDLGITDDSAPTS